MKDLIATINEIVKYGLEPNVEEQDKERRLERNLVKIYNLYFQIDYAEDDNEYPEFEKSYDEIRKNVESNFKDYGYYKKIADINNLDNFDDVVVGDAIDDLTDIILELLEVKSRIENNGMNDGPYYFEFAFSSHIQSHLINLLKYINQKK